MSNHRPPDEAEELLSQVYDQLRQVAARELGQERAGHTLQPTALVHEAYVRLVKLDHQRWSDRTHFFVAASRAIRRVLVDHARARATAKRGGGAGERLTLSGLADDDASSVIDLLGLDEALRRLADKDSRVARVVELRYFGGLTIQETARALSVGTTTVEEDWAFARSWLRRELGEESST